ncbi:hypothetical protein Bca4012_076627 [Brassica carinata]
MEREKKKKSSLNPFPPSSTVDGSVSITGGINEDVLHHEQSFHHLQHISKNKKNKREEKRYKIESPWLICSDLIIKH